MRHEALEVQIGDGLRHGAIVQFLGGVNLVPARDAAGVEVRNPSNVLADSANDIAFHDLHVVDVVQQLDPR